MATFGSYLTQKSSRESSLCVPDCGYRGLYESSQTSLSDLAEKQSSAIAARLRLRSFIVDMMRKWFAKQVVTAEATSGTRLDKMSDEAVLSLLSSMVGAAANPFKSSSTEAIDDLRAALAELGVAVPASTDLHAWASAVRQQRPQPTASFWDDIGKTPPKPETPPAPAPPTQTGQPVTTLPALPSATTVQPEGDAPIAWADLFAETQDEPEQPQEVAAEPEFEGFGGFEDEPLAFDVDIEPDDETTEPIADFDISDPTPVKVSTIPGHIMTPQVLPRSHASGHAIKKPITSKATPPGFGAGDDVEQSPAQKMASKVASPSPVFTKDLVALVGDSPTVDLWVEHAKGQPGAIVRAVSGRPNFRVFGQLVLPMPTALSKPPLLDSVWVDVLKAYSGTTLYDAAAVFKVAQDQGNIVSAVAEENKLTLFLVTPTGATAVVAIFATDSDSALLVLDQVLNDQELTRVDTVHVVYSHPAVEAAASELLAQPVNLNVHLQSLPAFTEQ